MLFLLGIRPNFVITAVVGVALLAVGVTRSCSHTPTARRWLGCFSTPAAMPHVLGDLDADPTFVVRLRNTGVLVIATLRVTALFSTDFASEVDSEVGDLLSQPRLAPYLDTQVSSTLALALALAPGDPLGPPTPRERARPHAGCGARLDFAGALQSTRTLHEAGVPILAGTDAAANAAVPPC